MIETLAIVVTVGAILFCVLFACGLVWLISGWITETAKDFEDDGA